MSIQWYMDSTRKVFEGITARINPEIDKFVEETEGMEGADLGFIQVGLAFSSEPLTPEAYIARVPYANPSSFETQMDGAVERGWLKKISAGQYGLSEKGMNTVQHFMEVGNQLFSNLPSLSKPEPNRIAELLAKLVEKAYQLPEPGDKPNMEIGIRLNPGVDAPPMLRIRRHLTDLNYFREDAHIAAWQFFLNVDGRIFETLTYLWQGEATTPVELSERISEYRYYDEDDYKRAFEDLVSLGWAVQEDGNYAITELGEKTRQKVEDRTDEYFARPFSILSEAETEELKSLLDKLAEVISPSEEEASD